eukprot:4247559-Amphidinium_carterae.2
MEVLATNLVEKEEVICNMKPLDTEHSCRNGGPPPVLPWDFGCPFVKTRLMDSTKRVLVNTSKPLGAFEAGVKIRRSTNATLFNKTRGRTHLFSTT